MDHDEAVRQKATERYLLDELDPELKDQFEEHLFDCQDCALDVRAGSHVRGTEQVVLAEPRSQGPVRLPVPAKDGMAGLVPSRVCRTCASRTAGSGRLSEFRHLSTSDGGADQPQVGPWASVNVSTRGAVKTPVVVTPGSKASVCWSPFRRTCPIPRTFWSCITRRES